MAPTTFRCVCRHFRCTKWQFSETTNSHLSFTVTFFPHVVFWFVWKDISNLRRFELPSFKVSLSFIHGSILACYLWVTRKYAKHFRVFLTFFKNYFSTLAKKFLKWKNMPYFMSDGKTFLSLLQKIHKNFAKEVLNISSEPIVWYCLSTI